jgi:peptidoglycan/LPS O-acetylase OafA/YrhL
MIKFPSKHATLYGFSMIAYGLIMGNIIFLTKVLNINNKKKLAYLIFISFLLFYLEMLLILFIFQWSVEINGEGLLYMLGLTAFIFYLCRSCLPYWVDE